MNEFDSMLRKHGVIATKDELTLLIDRFDRNRNGAVSYADFASEVAPKSPTKY
jgi:Ca2+-binding EF-hand superfamily protein